MDRVVVSAPGKLILMGEHAVVYGRPALVGAIGLRLRVALERVSGDGVELDLAALGERREVSWPDLRRATLAARDRWRRRFVEGGEDDGAAGVTPGELATLALGETVEALTEKDPGGIRMWIGSELPVGAGLGSSAALAVGVVGACLTLLDHPMDPAVVGAVALEVERRQHGLPSGVDHTAVLHGGLLWVERGPEGRLSVEPLGAEAPLLAYLRPFDSGRPGQSTGELVDWVRRRRQRDPASVEELLDEVEATTRVFRAALEASDLERAMGAVRQCERALENLGVVPAEHRATIRHIEARGGAAKISGAGSLSGPGAGCVLVFHPEPQRVAGWSFLDGWRPLDTLLPGEGLRLEEAR